MSGYKKWPHQEYHSMKVLLWNVEGAKSMNNSTSHDFSCFDVLAFTEMLSITGFSTDDRLWINRNACKNDTGRPFGGIAVGLSDDIMWNNATTFSSDHVIAVQSKMINLIVCYFKPLTPVTYINDEIVTALMCSRNSDCPTLLIGDFNCRLDCGERGYDLYDMLYSAGLVCLNNPNDMTYIAAQGQS